MASGIGCGKKLLSVFKSSRRLVFLLLKDGGGLGKKRLLGVSSYTLRRNIETGQIHAVRVGRRVLMPTKELERDLADKSAASGASSSHFAIWVRKRLSTG